MTVYVDSAFHPYGRMINGLPMNKVQFSENMDHEQLLVLHYRKQGKEKVHFCPDWDYMAIHANSPEFACCTCDKAALT